MHSQGWKVGKKHGASVAFGPGTCNLVLVISADVLIIICFAGTWSEAEVANF